MKKLIGLILVTVALFSAVLFLAGFSFGRSAHYSHADTHYVVCMGDSTGIVSESRFESLARKNMVCSAYEIDVDGLVEIDWEFDADTIRVWDR